MSLRDPLHGSSGPTSGTMLRSKFAVFFTENTNLDNVENAGQKLSHPTANRAKAPSSRRPPSHVKDLQQVRTPLHPEGATFTQDTVILPLLITMSHNQGDFWCSEDTH